MNAPKADAGVSVFPFVRGYTRVHPFCQSPLFTVFTATESIGQRRVLLKTERLVDEGAAPGQGLRNEFELATRLGGGKHALTPLLWLENLGRSVAVYSDDGFIRLSDAPESAHRDPGAFLELAIALTDCVRHVHRHNIVIANIGPESFWIDPVGPIAKLADLTQAYAADQAENIEPGACRDVRYLAPEQTGRMQRPVDFRTDLYRLGLVLYERAAGAPPFDSADPVDVVHGHFAREAPPLGLRWPELPAPVSDIVAKLLAKPPEDRYQSTDGLASDLRECLRQWQADRMIQSFPLGSRDASSFFTIARRLYGRDRDLGPLLAAYDELRRGAIRLVLISGAPGIGKSMLAEQLRVALRGQARFLTVKFEQYGHNEPYLLVPQVLRGALELLLTDDRNDPEFWRTYLLGTLGPNARLLSDLVPKFEHLLGPLPALPELPAAENRVRIQRVFTGLLRCIASRDTPCCLFIDDLQWADSASADLLLLLLTDPSLNDVLVIGAHRPELGEASDSVQSLLTRRPEISVRRLPLRGIDGAAIAELLSDTLRMPRHELMPLAALLLERTDGNPFHVVQLLNFLHHAQLLEFDHRQGRWLWDSSRIRSEGLTDDVIDLLARKLAAFPERTRHALRVAACLGHRFAARKLALVLGWAPDALGEALDPALQSGMIVACPDQPDPTTAPASLLRFVHDRVQQAAYGLTPRAELAALRLHIARSIHASLTAEEAARVPFDVVDNFNFATDLLHSDAERLHLAQLNLSAGLRARESAAFAAALGYFDAGIALLPASRLAEHHELALRLYLESFECAYVTGKPAHAEQRFRTVIEAARTRTEKARAYYTKVLLNTATARSDDAVAAGLEALQLFEESLPASPRKARLLAELMYTRVQLGRRRPIDLLRLPPLRDPEQQALLALLMSICPAAYFRNPNLTSLAALHIVRRSLRYGNATQSSFGYVLYGLIQGAVLGHYETGHEFGELAVTYAREDPDVVLRCKILLIFAGFVNFWRAPIDSSLTMLAEAFQMAFDCGDVQYANYAVLQLLFLKLARGTPLDEVLAECARYENFVHQTRDQFAIENLRLRKQFVRALQGLTGSGDSLQDSQFDEARAVKVYASMGNLTTLSYYYTLKAELAYLFGHFDVALAICARSEKQINAVLSQIMIVQHYLYWGLSLAATLRVSSKRTRMCWRRLRHCRRRLAQWARNCPENFGPQHRLLSAEIASLNGEHAAAERLYDQTIAEAEAANFVQITAIAEECAARHYLAQKRTTVAHAYLEQAQREYLAWGASAKVLHLQAFERDVFGPAGGPLRTTPRGFQPIETPQALRVDSVMRASAAIAVESELDRTLASLLRVFLQSLDAQFALIVAQSGGELKVEAGILLDRDDCVELTNETPNSIGFSSAVALFALRTGDPVSLNGSETDPRFAHCPHLSGIRPKGVFCAPMAAGAGGAAVVYCENRLVDVRFPTELSGPLKVVFQQIALVRANSVYAASLTERTEALHTALDEVAALASIRNHLMKFVPRSLQNLIEANPLAPELRPKDQDLTIVFLDIAGYTNLSQRLSRTTVQEIVETYFSAYVDDIYRFGGDISEILGDGLLVLFQHPDPCRHALNATLCARLMKETTARINSEYQGRWPPIAVNVGVHSGTVRLGAKRIEGSGGTRWTFAATGSATNLAARVGASAKDGEILLSAESARRVGTQVRLSSKGLHRLKGVDQANELYLVVDAEPNR